MRILTLLLILAGLSLTQTATPQAQVFGSGYARDCFEAAKYRSTNLRDAVRICDTALQQERLNRDNRAATYTNRGLLKMRLGRYDSALSDYATAKAIDETLGPTWLNEGAAYIYKKDFASALVSINKAIDLGTRDLHAAYYNRAIARENTGDVQGAYQDFQKALEVQPDFEEAKQQLRRFSVVSN